MRTNKAFLKSISINAYNNGSGLNGEILGVEYVISKGLESRPCYKVQYFKYITNRIIKDVIDYIPISDIENEAYKIVPFII